MASSIIEFRCGAETSRVYRRGSWVYKERRSNFGIIELHNRFFGTLTPYTVLERNESHWLVRQPYISFVPDSGEEARRMLFEQFAVNFVDAIRTDLEIWAGGFLFDDLKDGNIGIDVATTQPAVIDCLIRPWSKHDVLNLWRGADLPILGVKGERIV